MAKVLQCHEEADVNCLHKYVKKSPGVADILIILKVKSCLAFHLNLSFLWMPLKPFIVGAKILEFNFYQEKDFYKARISTKLGFLY